MIGGLRVYGREVVVRWNHSLQGRPQTIEEVRRILTEHAAATR